MIFITADCHGNFERFNVSIFPEQNEMTKEELLLGVVKVDCVVGIVKGV